MPLLPETVGSFSRSRLYPLPGLTITHSRADEAYVTLFLITYRRFARPFDVLEKLIERFEFVAKRLKSDPLLSRFAQMK